MVPDYIIATDGGVLLDPNKAEVPGAYAYVILNCKTMNYIIQGDALNGKTINYAESYAIYKALKYLRKLTKDKPTNVLVISDSKLTVLALSVWSKENWNTSDPYNWKKSTGQKVKNQEIYRKIQKEEAEGNIFIKYAHINSHLDIDSSTDITKIKYKVLDYGVTVSNREARLIMLMNKWADDKATEMRTKWLRSRRGFKVMLPKKEV